MVCHMTSAKERVPSKWFRKTIDSACAGSRYTIISGMNALFNIVSMGPPLKSAGDVLVWSFVSLDGREVIGPAAALIVPTVTWGGT